MTAIKSDSNPDKRGRAKPDNYLENWIERQSLVESMIPIIGKFHREKNVRILLYGIPLISLSVIEIMQTHRTVREVEENELSEYESSMILASCKVPAITTFFLSLTIAREMTLAALSSP